MLIPQLPAISRSPRCPHPCAPALPRARSCTACRRSCGPSRLCTCAARSTSCWTTFQVWLRHVVRFTCLGCARLAYQSAHPSSCLPTMLTVMLAMVLPARQPLLQPPPPPPPPQQPPALASHASLRRPPSATSLAAASQPGQPQAPAAAAGAALLQPLALLLDVNMAAPIICLPQTSNRWVIGGLPLHVSLSLHMPRGVMRPHPCGSSWHSPCRCHHHAALPALSWTSATSPSQTAWCGSLRATNGC